MLRIGELGLTHYSSRTLLKGLSLHKSSIQKQRQQLLINACKLVHKYWHASIGSKANILWQEGKLRRGKLIRDVINITSIAKNLYDTA